MWYNINIQSVGGLMNGIPTEVRDNIWSIIGRLRKDYNI